MHFTNRNTFLWSHTRTLPTRMSSQLFKINTVAQVPNTYSSYRCFPACSIINLLMCSQQTFEAAFSLDCRIPLHAYPNLCVRRCRITIQSYTHIHTSTHPHIHTSTHPRRPSWEVGELTTEEEKLIPSLSHPVGGHEGVPVFPRTLTRVHQTRQLGPAVERG